MRSSMTSLLKPLSKLYTETGEDWIIEIHHILTEPTCPTVTIRPERWPIARYRFDCDSIEEGVALATQRVTDEILNRQFTKHEAPYTESIDGLFAKWLSARAAGSNDKLPEPPTQI